jgi:hypothetical protein
MLTVPPPEIVPICASGFAFPLHCPLCVPLLNRRPTKANVTWTFSDPPMPAYAPVPLPSGIDADAVNAHREPWSPVMFNRAYSSSSSSALSPCPPASKENRSLSITSEPVNRVGHRTDRRQTTRRR